MKICVLTDAWKPVWGGGQVHIWEVSQRLIKDYDCQVDIIVPNLANNPGVISLGPRFVFPNLFGRAAFIFTALGFCLTHNYDIYHSHSFSTHLILPLVKLLKRAKVGITLHGKPVDFLGGGLLNKIGLPQVLANLILGYPYDFVLDVQVIGNGVDVSRFDAIKARKDPNGFKILWVGRSEDPIKGVRFLKEAVRGIPNVKLSLVNNKYGEALIKEYKSSNLFVLPSLSEGLPLVLLEAMAAKLPIVATDVGSCRRLVEEAKSGLVVKPGDAAALAGAIAKMIRTKGLGKLGENGYRFVKKNYSWDLVVQRVARAIGVTMIKRGTK